MHSSIKRLGAVLAGVFAVLGLTVLPASAGAGDSIFKMSAYGVSLLDICHDITGTNPYTCGNHISDFPLYPGERSSTKYGFADTDGFWVGQGYAVLDQQSGVWYYGGPSGCLDPNSNNVCFFKRSGDVTTITYYYKTYHSSTRHPAGVYDRNDHRIGKALNQR